MKFTRFECQCTSLQHNIRFGLDEGDGSLYVEAVLDTWLPWHKRLIAAFWYLFRPGRSRYGSYDEVLLRPEDRERLRELLAESERIASQK